MLLTEALDEFIFERRIRGLSAKTISDYEEFVKPFIRFVGEKMTVERLTQKAIQQYMLLLFDRKLSKATVSTYIRHIRVFLSWAASGREVKYDIKKIPLPKTGKKQVHLYSDDEIRLIFDTITAESEWLTIRNKACVALMLDSGLRRGEVCGAKIADYDKERQLLTVTGKGDKTRIVPVGSFSKKYIDQYLELCPFKDSEYLFVDRRGNPVSGNALKLLMQKLSQKLPFDFSCHKLRHNFATNYCLDMYEQKGHMDAYSLQILLGHEDLKTTMRYIHHATSIVASQAHLSHLDKIM